MQSDSLSPPPLPGEVRGVTGAEAGERLKWLMLFRLLFTIFLLASTLILHFRGNPLTSPPGLIPLYELIGVLFFLSVVYTALLGRIKRLVLFAYFQIAVDTFAVTLVIFLTGSFVSFFGFLYLVVIIYASMILSRGGSIIMAALCSIQYGILVDLEYYGMLHPYGMEGLRSVSDYPWHIVIYKILSIIVSCFAVAFLSGFLSSQIQKTRRDLKHMEAHVRRVERMAAIGEMAAGLAHEIKNPLASLRGAVQFLQEEMQCGGEQKDLMDIVLREADRLNSLVADFLMFARPPAGRAELVDPADIVTDTLTVFQRSDRCESQVEITTDIQSGICVKLDPNHLRQILWNLLLNAVEAFPMTDEGKRVHIRVARDRENRAVIAVHDSGSGIAPEKLPLIFDPFLTTKAGGTGLGLSIVHRLVEHYSGFIEVDSDPGNGSVFTVHFPGCDEERL
ncbi:MAG: two-component sensor histidine kinase [Desulfobacterales bacterium]|nr:MAG: two-component sensor histidine kinase [Desulfobacterales bacterium]